MYIAHNHSSTARESLDSRTIYIIHFLLQIVGAVTLLNLWLTHRKSIQGTWFWFSRVFARHSCICADSLSVSASSQPLSEVCCPQCTFYCWILLSSHWIVHLFSAKALMVGFLVFLTVLAFIPMVYIHIQQCSYKVSSHCPWNTLLLQPLIVAACQTLATSQVCDYNLRFIWDDNCTDNTQCNSFCFG